MDLCEDISSRVLTEFFRMVLFFSKGRFPLPEFTGRVHGPS